MHWIAVFHLKQLIGTQSVRQNRTVIWTCCRFIRTLRVGLVVLAAEVEQALVVAEVFKVALPQQIRMEFPLALTQVAERHLDR